MTNCIDHNSSRDAALCRDAGKSVIMGADIHIFVFCITNLF